MLNVLLVGGEQETVKILSTYIENYTQECEIVPVDPTRVPHMAEVHSPALVIADMDVLKDPVGLVKQLGRTFKTLRLRSGAELRHVAERIDLGHGFDNKGSGIIKRVALLRDFEEGKPDTLTAAHWVNIAEFFNISFSDFIDKKGWPAPPLERAVYVIQCLQERFPDK
jgi:hypothetical protein